VEKIGFIGLGIMGKPMAKNLLSAGYRLVVHSRSPGPVTELESLGAEVASSPKEVAQKSNIIITMLPDSGDVEDVILGKNGVLEGVLPGSVLIDMSSIAPATSRKIHIELKKKGADMLDAPVSGGESGAKSAALSIMVGGPVAALRRCEKILATMGKSVVHVGDIGAGNFVKLANQMIVAINIEAISEALILATKAGVDPELLYRAIRGGLAGSNVLDAKFPAILERNFKPGFRARLHHKDLSNALQAAKELNVPLPVTAIVQQMLTALMAAGRGDDDHSAICSVLERLAGAEVGRN
jgi:2-hydroxy-3-oxopropionate reductase